MVYNEIFSILKTFGFVPSNDYFQDIYRFMNADHGTIVFSSGIRSLFQQLVGTNEDREYLRGKTIDRIEREDFIRTMIGITEVTLNSPGDYRAIPETTNIPEAEIQNFMSSISRAWGVPETFIRSTPNFVDTVSSENQPVIATIGEQNAISSVRLSSRLVDNIRDNVTSIVEESLGSIINDDTMSTISNRIHDYLSSLNLNP